MLRRPLHFVLCIAAGQSACGSSSSDPTITASEVHLSTSQMDVVFERTEPITSQLPRQVVHEYYLVQEAELVDAKAALTL